MFILNYINTITGKRYYQECSEEPQSVLSEIYIGITLMQYVEYDAQTYGHPIN